ncbi:MAG TPA: hypothetical protein ENH10_02430, partial [Bacteroidetes bacterium]|nr:hypothetical protein [Bacteroidota bacterium]HEX03997.1 hypothetical protein [Bacteroidota bacterium]
MTIVEFLHPIKGGAIRDLCLAALYFSQRYNQNNELTVEELRALLKRARVPRAAKLNLADTLSKSAPFVDTAGKKGRSFLWSLTPTGQEHVRSLLGLPEAEVEIEHDVSALESLLQSIADQEVSDYLGEAITCLSVGALRAAVVFLWAGTIRKIQQDCVACGASNLDAAIHKHDPKARNIKKIDDLSYVKESILLLAAQDLGLFDKNEKATLTD